jgi:hypothetical protein
MPHRKGQRNWIRDDFFATMPKKSVMPRSLDQGGDTYGLHIATCVE